MRAIAGGIHSHPERPVTEPPGSELFLSFADAAREVRP